MTERTKKPIKKILFSILGTSPQILTETVYALTQNEPAFVPDEIYVLTTGFGADQCIRGLFQADGGWFHKLCQVYNLEDIAFSPKHVIRICNEENEVIQDIRTPSDNRAVANQISQMIRDFTSDPQVHLHVSIAGGRKTMGFYAGYALSMFGRDQDQLSHVLVQDQFESELDFYFPTPYSEIFPSRRQPEVYFDKKDAKVELAFLPFVRMRHAIDDKLLENIEDFNDMVNLLQRQMRQEQQTVKLICSELALEINGVTVPLTRMNFIFYYWVAKKWLEGESIRYDFEPGDSTSMAYSTELFVCVDEIFTEGTDEHTTAIEDLEARFDNGLKKRFLDDRKIEIKETLTQYLGVNAPLYLIEKLPGKKANGMKLKPNQIEFA